VPLATVIEAFYDAGCERQETDLIWWRSRTQDCTVDLGDGREATAQFETWDSEVLVRLRDW
jgi:hypothetical protein